TEEAVAQVWQEVLQLDRIGVHDNFFDLGGHSLLATRAAIRLHAAFGVDIGVRTLFERPTVARLAGAVEERLMLEIAAMSTEDVEQALKEQMVAEEAEQVLREQAVADGVEKALREQAVAEGVEQVLREQAVADGVEQALREQAVAEDVEQALRDHGMSEDVEPALAEPATTEGTGIAPNAQGAGGDAEPVTKEPQA
ncbi:phosphopantetheine-binding protein, partial [Streptomyces sp. NPDC048514]|uniref:phosphopantetheine-binding protein n=1 Tax=Streptomyces sp. NPDC048514 TaxID=3365564 RepID=UPI003711ACF4